MEFEKEVVAELIKYGYPIFYKNLKIFYNNYDLTELDIVSNQFILEVKSTKFGNCRNKGFNMFYRHNLLPDNFTYFVYSPQSTTDEIKEYQELYTNPSYIFINNLKDITNIIKPIKNISVDSDSLFSRLLNLSNDELKRINKIYMPYDVYSKVYTRLVSSRDTYSQTEYIWWSEKLDRLIKENKISFDTNYADYTYPMKKNIDKIYSHKIKLKSLSCKISVDLSYYIDNFRRSPDMVYRHITSPGGQDFNTLSSSSTSA